MEHINVLMISADWDQPVKLAKIEPALKNFNPSLADSSRKSVGRVRGFVNEEGKYMGLARTTVQHHMETS